MFDGFFLLILDLWMTWHVWKGIFVFPSPPNIVEGVARHSYNSRDSNCKKTTRKKENRIEENKRRKAKNRRNKNNERRDEEQMRKCRTTYITPKIVTVKTHRGKRRTE